MKAEERNEKIPAADSEKAERSSGKAFRFFGGKVVYHSGWLRPIDIMHQAASSASSSVRFSSQNSVITFLIISSSASTGKPAASQ